MQYDEPPAWFYPVRQSLGAALLRNGQATEAEAVSDTLAMRPRDGRLLFGLWQSCSRRNATARPSSSSNSSIPRGRAPR